jgi:hypothetical protein
LLIKFKPKEIYLRSFLLLGIAFTIGLTILANLITHLISKQALDELGRFTLHKLGQTVNNTDYTLLKIETGLRIFTDNQVRAWLFEEAVIEEESGGANWGAEDGRNWRYFACKVTNVGNVPALYVRAESPNGLAIGSGNYTRVLLPGESALYSVRWRSTDLSDAEAAIVPEIRFRSW